MTIANKRKHINRYIRNDVVLNPLIITPSVVASGRLWLRVCGGPNLDRSDRPMAGIDIFTVAKDSAKFMLINAATVSVYVASDRCDAALYIPMSDALLASLRFVRFAGECYSTIERNYGRSCGSIAVFFWGINSYNRMLRNV